MAYQFYQNNKIISQNIEQQIQEKASATETMISDETQNQENTIASITTAMEGNSEMEKTANYEMIGGAAVEAVPILKAIPNLYGLGKQVVNKVGQLSDTLNTVSQAVSDIGNSAAAASSKLSSIASQAPVMVDPGVTSGAEGNMFFSSSVNTAPAEWEMTSVFQSRSSIAPLSSFDQAIQDQTLALNDARSAITSSATSAAQFGDPNVDFQALSSASKPAPVLPTESSGIEASTTTSTAGTSSNALTEDVIGSSKKIATQTTAEGGLEAGGIGLGELFAEGGALAAVPVVGEIAAAGLGIFSLVEGILGLGHHSDPPPPPPLPVIQQQTNVSAVAQPSV